MLRRSVSVLALSSVSLLCMAHCGDSEPSGSDGGVLCGDGVRQVDEECDGVDLSGEDCISRGFPGGTLACNANCDGFDTSACTGIGLECGNNVAEGTEVCDGVDLSGADCISQGYTGGTLACNDNCDGFNTSACTGIGTASYIGIPEPNFGGSIGNPTLTESPADPPEWPSASAAGYFYVEPDHANSSDVPTGGEPVDPEYGRYGYPDRPRASIPSSAWIGDIFAAGTVIKIKGGTFSSGSFYGVWSPRLHGEADNPVWIMGDPADPPTFTDTRIHLFDSQYFFLEHLTWGAGNTDNQALTVTRDRPGDSHHGTLRHLRFENRNYIGGGGAHIGIFPGQAGNNVYDIVAFRNTFKGCGGGFDWQTMDGDHHGYKINGGAPDSVRRIWVLENEALLGDVADPIDGIRKSISGNLVQVGDELSQVDATHHIYIAGNFQDGGRQSLAGTKVCRDVIISQNTCVLGFGNYVGTNGQAFTTQYDARWVWFIANHAYDAMAGWMHTGGDPDVGPFFVIGNVFSNIHVPGGQDGWRRGAIAIWTNSGDHYIVGNTMDDVDFGIWVNAGGGSGTYHIANNIVSNLVSTTVVSDANFLRVSAGGFANNNLFYNAEQFRIEWGGSTYTDLASFNGLTSAASNLEGDPAYVDQAGGDLHVGSSSPAIGNGAATVMDTAEDVNQMFEDRYSNDPDYPGIPNIRFDFDSVPRPAGAVSSIGAYE